VEVLPTEDLRSHAARLLRTHPLRAADAVHLAAASDGHSGYGLAVLAPARNTPMAAAAVKRLHRELAAESIPRIGRLRTDHGTDFVGKPTPAFEARCARQGAGYNPELI